MLAKVPKSRDAKTSSFKTLIRYITRSEGNAFVSRSEHVLSHTFDTEILSVENTPCFHNCVSINTAYKEMLAVARKNVKVADPVYHLIVSWPDSDSPSHEQIRLVVLDTLDKMGFKGHQYVMAIHHDTGNTHVHLAVNRVHPETFQAVEKYNDYYRLDYIMRELEIKYGFTREVGHYKTNVHDGNISIVKAKKGDRAVNRRHDDMMSEKATLMEVHSGRQSLQRYVQETLGSEVKSFFGDGEQKSWERLHALMGAHGLELVPFGRGFVIRAVDASHVRAVKASSLDARLGKAKLEVLLGAYQSSDARYQAVSRYSTDTFLTPKTERDKRRMERASGRFALRQRYRAEKAAFTPRKIDQDEIRGRFKALHQWARQAKARHASISERDIRLASNGLVAFLLSKELYKLRLDLREERNAIRFAPDNRFPTYREWVQQQAAAGDDAAIRQLRGWHYQQQRKMNHVAPKHHP